MFGLRKLLSAALISVSIAGPVIADTQLLSPSDQDAVAPDMAVSANGDIAILWADRSPEMTRDTSAETTASQRGHDHSNFRTYHDLYIAISQDGGDTFGAPVKVNHELGVVRGQSINRPRVAGSSDGTWHVSYAANDLHPTIGKPVMTQHYTRSTDGGMTFETPRRLSAMTDTDGSEFNHGGFMTTAGFQTIIVKPDGPVSVAWIDTRFRTEEGGDAALYNAVSKDGGASFMPEQQVFETHVCPCCQLTTALDANGEILMGYRDVSPDGFRQSTVVRLDAASGTAGAPVQVGTAPWEIAGCPLKPTVVAASGEKVFAAMYSGGEDEPGVFFSHSVDGGASFSRAEAVHPGALVSDWPAVAVNEDYVLVAWHAKAGGPRRIFYRHYQLDGKPAGGVQFVDSGESNASSPVAVTRADGRFQVAWEQDGLIRTRTLPAAPSEIEVGLR
jgi:hypothetical protein